MLKLARSLGLVLLAIVAACTSPGRDAARSGPDAGPRPVILVSLDGFRADYLGRGLTPNIAGLAADGVRAEGMRPAFPSLTIPTHYTLVTGLYPDHHGIVDNTMEDPALGRFTLSDRAALGNPRWWEEGTPLWVTLQQHGLHTGLMFWPGSDVRIHGVLPDHYFAYDKAKPYDERVDTVLSWLDLPPDQRPAFISLYFEKVDSQGHYHGPDSPEVDQALGEVDRAIGLLVDGLKQRGFFDRADLIIVADHGMAAVSPDRVIVLDSFLDPKSFHLVDGGALAGLRPEPGYEGKVAKALQKAPPHLHCMPKQKLPPRLHYGTNDRVPPFLCLPDTGWLVTTRNEAAKHKSPLLGQHGFDPADPRMAALFVAHGPDFRKGVVVPAFDNVDVYPLLMRLVGVAPLPSDGTLSDLAGILKQPGS